MKLREEFDIMLDNWLASKQIVKGSNGVSVNVLLADFEVFACDTIPITKAMFGRAMTERFVKKQNRQTLEQNYYINVEM